MANNSNSLLYNNQQSMQAPPFDLNTFLKKHLRFTKRRIKYHREELTTLCLQAQYLLQKDNPSALIEIPCLPIYIVGDIHGQWRDLLRIFATLGVPGKSRYLFLGDYVDRGMRSLECICLLLALKLKYPTKVYMLRGNHECDYINWNYGFKDEIGRRFTLGDSMAVFKAFNNLFNYLPLAAVVVNRILCMHGGISPKLNSLDTLRKIRLPTKVAHNDGLTLDLIWSDPIPKEKAEKGVKGFVENDLRECSYFFGAETVIKLCDKLGLDCIIRGHQAMKNGFGFFAKQHLLTIFSAPGYLMPETNSFGAVVKISKNYELSITIFRPKTMDDNRTFEQAFEDHKSTNMGTESDITKIEKMPKDMPSESLMGKG